MSTLQFLREIVTDRVQVFMAKDEKPKITEPEPFQQITKSGVLQESRCFNDQQINDRKCKSILSKLIYLINQGEVFNEAETQTLFFGITKLFQSNNADLRRMIYLMIKSFRDENSMYVVISCLTKDIVSKNDLFRLNALRTLPLVLEPSNLVQLERYLKNAILDKSQPISSAALTAGLQIFCISPEFIRKWSNEVAERLNSKYPQNSFHALLLLHEIKKNDSITFTKVLLQLSKETLVPIANMQVIRFIREILPEVDQVYEKQFIDYLLRQVHKAQEMVIFEACKALCEVKSLANKDLQPMVQVVSVFLVSNNVVNKFVALKLLNKLIVNPIRRSLITSTQSIESLIQDSNKSLSSLAVSILLKICQEQNIEKLLSQIQEYLNDMSDEFKIDVLRSVKSLVKNSPKKWKAVINFLKQTIKYDASIEFKQYAVEIFETVIEIPEAREFTLLALAEYIEDCSQIPIQLNVLSILNREAQKKQCPTKIIRIVNNRLHLEQAEVRAASVGVLGKFINEPQVQNLIKAAAQDPDDEVRNRCNYYLNKPNPIEPLSLTELDALESYLQYNIQEIQASNDDTMLNMDRVLKFAESNVGKVKKTEVAHIIEQEEIEQVHHQSDFDTYKKLIQESPIFKEYGPLRKAVPPIQLTDTKSEYLVSVGKFLFDNHIILEYKIKNTLTSSLNDVHVNLKIDNEANLKLETMIPVKQIDSQCTTNLFVGLMFKPDLRVVSSSIRTILAFVITENGTSYDDEYQVEDFNITFSDFFHEEVWFKSFKMEWDRNATQEASSTFQLNYKNTDIAIKELQKHFGLAICESTDVIQPNNKFHTLLLSGKYLGERHVLLIAQIGFQQNIGCILKLRVKTDEDVLSHAILSTLE